MRAVRPVSSTYGTAGPTEFRPVPLGTVDQARLARIDAQRRRRRVLAGPAGRRRRHPAPQLRAAAAAHAPHLIDALLLCYVGLLVRRRKLAVERAAKVRYMNQAQARRQRQPARPAVEREPGPSVATPAPSASPARPSSTCAPPPPADHPGFGASGLPGTLAVP